MLETPDLSYVGAEDSKRQFCVATVRRDARTGTVSVTAAGDGLTARENPNYTYNTHTHTSPKLPELERFIA